MNRTPAITPVMIKTMAKPGRPDEDEDESAALVEESPPSVGSVVMPGLRDVVFPPLLLFGIAVVLLADVVL